ncbi:hypothetical protein BJX66DRAFT_320101 [Aspergillus keveii]|uniref:Secreted protein n=1 Tax=Aspergillus keveii TaxID=714993 RepID=A0ABR4FHH8_9EURO
MGSLTVLPLTTFVSGHRFGMLCRITRTSMSSEISKKSVENREKEDRITNLLIVMNFGSTRLLCSNPISAKRCFSKQDWWMSFWFSRCATWPQCAKDTTICRPAYKRFW